MDCPQPDKEKPLPQETALVAVSDLSPLDRISGYSHLQRVTAWIFWFVTNSCATWELQIKDHLSAKELTDAEMLWVKSTQLVEFLHEISTLKARKELTANSKILKLQPFLDQRGLLRVGGRLNLSNQKFSFRSLIILSCKRKLMRFLVENEHLKPLHAGPTLVAVSLAQKYHIMGSCRIISLSLVVA